MALDKGVRVEITRGKHGGAFGTVFWLGPNKYGPGQRVGVRTDAGETVWATDGQVREVTGAAVSREPEFVQVDTEDSRSPSVGARIWFVEPPSELALEALGHRWATWKWTSDHGSGAWRFSDAQAEVVFEPRGRHQELTARDRLRELLSELHESAPIRKAELILGAGPAAGTDLRAHPAFIAGLEAGLSETGDAGLRALKAEVEQLGLSLQASERVPFPEPEDYPDWARKWCRSSKDSLGASTGAPELVVSTPAAAEFSLPVDTCLVLNRVPLTPDAALLGLGDIKKRRPHPSTTALGVLRGDQARVVWTIGDADVGLFGFAWLDGQHVIALSKKRLIVLDLGAERDACAEVDVAAASGHSLFVFGDLVVTNSRFAASPAKGALNFYAWVNGQLRRLGRINTPGVGLAYTHTEAPVLSYKPEGSDAHSYYALLGVAARLEAEHAKKQKRGRAKRTTEK